ncbi:hypothetical protein [Thiohalomonas denitrificans]|uniref:hypothetical protein n=1 Tax=Thiohalomonas denitrificans TaxID=415747 RepID=UPI0026F09FE1|nr:hypothetical protein [Thiohalomonas denitrificans]
MERKTKIQAIIGNAQGVKGTALLTIGVLIGIGTTTGGIALYYTGYKEGLVAAAPQTPRAPIPASILELPPPFDDNIQETKLHREGTDKRQLQSF